jgi:hypothetical protein
MPSEIRASIGANEIERRSLIVEVRLAAPDSRLLAGHAAVYNERADICGLFTETIAPGAFAAVLRSTPDVVALWDHQPSALLGRTAAGTLRLREDGAGLAFELDVPNTTLGNDVLEHVRVGNVRGMSFAFRVGEERWDHATNLRTVLSVAGLYDVSPVVHPAYGGTDIALRSRSESLAAWQQQERAARLRNRLRLYLARREEEQP